MGGKFWGVVVVLALLTGTTTAAAEPVTKPAHQEADLPAELAEQVVSATPEAAPDPIAWGWESCNLPITINYAAGPGIDPAVVLDQLVYPVRYLQALGYTAMTGVEVPYVPEPDLPSEPGTVLVVATLDRTELPSLRNSKFRAWAENGAGYPAQSTARIDVDANRGLSSLVLLHELGHVIGLPHKEDTVMSTNGTSSNGFDAAETAAIDCRL